MISLAASSRLQNATKYCTNVRKMGPVGRVEIIQPLLHVESPNFTRISMPTWYTAAPDMTSSAISGRHLSKFEKKNGRKCCLGDEFDWCCILPVPPIGGLLVYSYIAGSKSVSARPTQTLPITTLEAINSSNSKQRKQIYAKHFSQCGVVV